jgi:ABC-type uncharacterized transport system ATPase subunit
LAFDAFDDFDVVEVFPDLVVLDEPFCVVDVEASPVPLRPSWTTITAATMTAIRKRGARKRAGLRRRRSMGGSA